VLIFLLLGAGPQMRRWNNTAKWNWKKIYIFFFYWPFMYITWCPSCYFM